MLKGLALTPPTIGRIAIGKVVERNGKRLPEKDDEFTLTSQVQNKDGWVLHPLDQLLRKPTADKTSQKLRAIPVRLLFNDPDLNLRANYSLFDRHNGRPMCVGNGETCKRVTSSGVQSLPCPSPHACELAVGGSCKPYGRLNVRVVADDGETDELGSFVFRTTGFNSIRTLSARLRYFQAVSGNHLSTLPLELRLRGKSTTLSHRSPIYYVDLVIRSGTTLANAVQTSKEEALQLTSTGFDQTALDEAARQGFAFGAFEESEEEGVAVVEEFYPEDGGEDVPPAEGVDSQLNDSGKLRNASGGQARGERGNLGHKLGQRLKAHAGLMEGVSRSTTKSATDDKHRRTGGGY